MNIFPLPHPLIISMTIPRKKMVKNCTQFGIFKSGKIAPLHGTFSWLRMGWAKLVVPPARRHQLPSWGPILASSGCWQRVQIRTTNHFPNEYWKMLLVQRHLTIRGLKQLLLHIFLLTCHIWLFLRKMTPWKLGYMFWLITYILWPIFIFQQSELERRDYNVNSEFQVQVIRKEF